MNNAAVANGVLKIIINTKEKCKRETSVSKMLRDELERLIKQFEQYELSKKRAYANLKAGFHFGGKITATREELHKKTLTPVRL